MNTSSNVNATPEPARDGSTTARIGERYLHSRYNPEREAETFVAQAYDFSSGSGTPGASIVFIVGSALPFAAKALLMQAPHVGVIVTLEPVEELIDPDFGDPRCTRLPVSDPSAAFVRRMIRSRIKPWELGRLQVLVWPAAESLMPEWTGNVGSAMVDALQDVQAELATIAVFGRRWLHNALYGTLRWDYRYAAVSLSAPLLVATSGPSLNNLHPEDVQGGRGIVATSSSLHWFNYHKIPVKLAVHTDGGVWASRYLADSTKGMIVSLPIRSARVGVSHPMPMRTGWIGEDVASDAPSWPELPEQPTVGASVLTLAAGISSDDLFLTGLDLCSRDLTGHAAPHRNDLFFRARCQRLYPEIHQRVERLWYRGERLEQRWVTGEPGWQDPAMATYQPVLEDIIQQLSPRKIYGLTGISPVLATICHPYTGAPLPRRQELAFIRHERPRQNERQRHASLTLRRWEDVLRSAPEPQGLADPVCGELAMHIAPGELNRWASGGTAWNTVVDAAVQHIQTMRRRSGCE